MKITIIHPYSSTVIDRDSQKVPIQELDIIDNSSCLAVHLADAMDYVPFDQRILLLSKAVSKLRSGGEFTVSGTNTNSVMRQMMSGSITIEQFNASMFSGRLSAYNLYNVEQQIVDAGCEIINSKIDGLYYAIKARRKNNG